MNTISNITSTLHIYKTNFKDYIILGINILHNWETTRSTFALDISKFFKIIIHSINYSVKGRGGSFGNQVRIATGYVLCNRYKIFKNFKYGLKS